MAISDESFMGTPRFRSSITGQVYSSMDEARQAEASRAPLPGASAAAAPSLGAVAALTSRAVAALPRSDLPADFQWDQYIRANPDLRGMDRAQAEQHYRTYGAKENRRLAPTPVAVRPTPVPAEALPRAAPAGPSQELLQARQQMLEADRARAELLARKRAEMAAVRPQAYKKGGAVQSRRGDGIAKRGFTKGRMV